MTILFFKIFHIFGLLLMFTALGGMVLHVVNGGGKDNPGRKLTGIAHGVGLVLLLVSGFLMLTKLGVGVPGWAWAKLVLWLFFGASTAIIWRKPEMAKILWFVLPLLGTVGAYLALYKPF